MPSRYFDVLSRLETMFTAVVIDHFTVKRSDHAGHAVAGDAAEERVGPRRELHAQDLGAAVECRASHPTTAPLVPFWIVRLWPSGDLLVNAILTVPAFAVSVFLV